jgi:predicted CXXCH cytochrome family protein
MSIRKTTLIIASLLLAGGVGADVRDTKHNLAGRAGADREQRDGSLAARQNQEVCVFCHTPGVADLAGQGSSSEEPVARVAKWQRSLDAAFTFEMFDDIGKIGVDGGAAVGSISMACLSCHDAVQAFGITPGSGSDHPFGVPYRGSRQRVGQSASVFRDRAVAETEAPASLGRYLGDDAEFRPVRSGVINRRQVWWAGVNDTGQRSKNDLPLYPRRVDEGLSYEQVPFVECTSCHDPHSSRAVFLRMANDQSKLCMTCHVK